MSKVTNKQIIDTVVESMPGQEGANLKGLYGAELYSVVSEYPQNANPFINTLMNKVVKTMIHSKLFENPLKQLKAGKLELGESIEQVFVHKASVIDFDKNFEGSTTPEGDLLKMKTPKVDVLYISKNMDKKAAHSVKDKDLRKAFITEYGLSNLIAQIIGQISGGLEKHEYKAMRDVLCRAIDGIDYNGTSLIKNGFQKMHAVDISGYDQNPSLLVEKVRGFAGVLKYPHEEYNLAKVETETDKKDLVLVTDPWVSAKLDTQVLAHAFNVSATELNVRCIEVDQFTCKGEGGKYLNTEDGLEHLPVEGLACVNSAVPAGKTVVGVLMDKEFLQIYDTYTTMTSFYNPAQLFTSYFAFREYIMACALFKNIVVFYK